MTEVKAKVFIELKTVELLKEGLLLQYEPS